MICSSFTASKMPKKKQTPEKSSLSKSTSKNRKLDTPGQKTWASKTARNKQKSPKKKQTPEKSPLPKSKAKKRKVDTPGQNASASKTRKEGSMFLIPHNICLWFSALAILQSSRNPMLVA